MIQHRKYRLTGRNALNEPVKLAKDCVALTGHADYFRVVRESPEQLKLITGKGTYLLTKQATLNIYQGTWQDSSKRTRKMQITLKKIIGELHIW
jgi:hypothetical protein